MNAPTALSGPPPRFLADANFNLRVVAGLRRRQPQVEVMTARDLDLRETPDPELLAYAAMQGWILLTHDRKTMPGHFRVFLASLGEGEHSPGVIWIAQQSPIGRAVEELLEIWSCSSHDEWRDQFTYLPL